jgi:NodT family efflux transporter outer membrane factor (OMF) lipoprotein
MNMKPHSLLLLALLAGCAVTHVDAPRPAPAPAQFKETGLWQHARPDLAVPDTWWTLFNDPVLDDLEQRLLVGNENLKSVAAQVANARALLAAADAAWLPTLSLDGSGTRSKANSSGTPSARSITNSASLSANASWELDLWGRISEGQSQARAGLQAGSADLAAAKLSAQALLLQSYLALRTAEVQGELLDRSVVAYTRSLELTRDRHAGGVAAQTDVLQAETQLNNAKAQAADLKAQRAQAEHALAVLLGLPPSALKIEPAAHLPTAPDVPELLPATLLERRPDIAAAQARVASAYAQIGIADAAYFPSLTLSANGGYRSSTLSQLISTPNLFWSVGASMAESLLDGGQRKLASAQARNAADIATATYRQTVLTALQEVEDNLVLAEQLRRQAELQSQAVDAARRNLEITQDQYRAGTVGYLNVVTAQTALLSSESSLIGVRDRQLVAVGTLLKNIAGRWEPAKP